MWLQGAMSFWPIREPPPKSAESSFSFTKSGIECVMVHCKCWFPSGASNKIMFSNVFCVNNPVPAITQPNDIMQHTCLSATMVHLPWQNTLSFTTVQDFEWITFQNLSICWAKLSGNQIVCPYMATSPPVLVPSWPCISISAARTASQGCRSNLKHSTLSTIGSSLAHEKQPLQDRHERWHWTGSNLTTMWTTGLWSPEPVVLIHESWSWKDSEHYCQVWNHRWTTNLILNEGICCQHFTFLNDVKCWITQI